MNRKKKQVHSTKFLINVLCFSIVISLTTVIAIHCKIISIKRIRPDYNVRHRSSLDIYFDLPFHRSCYFLKRYSESIHIRINLFRFFCLAFIDTSKIMMPSHIFHNIPMQFTQRFVICT